MGTGSRISCMCLTDTWWLVHSAPSDYCMAGLQKRFLQEATQRGRKVEHEAELTMGNFLLSEADRWPQKAVGEDDESSQEYGNWRGVRALLDAKTHFEKGLALAERRSKGSITALINIAVAQNDLDCTSDACKRLLERALAECEPSRDEDELQRIHHTFASMYMQRGEYGLALSENRKELKYVTYTLSLMIILPLTLVIKRFG